MRFLSTCSSTLFIFIFLISTNDAFSIIPTSTPVQCFDQSPAVEGYTDGRWASHANDMSYGWRFKVDAVSNVNVTALGAADHGSNGFEGALKVTLWNDSGVQLASVVLQAGTSNTLIDGYRYESITPLTLNYNEYYRIAVYYWGAIDFVHLEATAVTTVSSISYDAALFEWGDKFPTCITTYGGIFGPNFIISSEVSCTPTATDTPAETPTSTPTRTPTETPTSTPTSTPIPKPQIIAGGWCNTNVSAHSGGTMSLRILVNSPISADIDTVEIRKIGQMNSALLLPAIDAPNGVYGFDNLPVSPFFLPKNNYIVEVVAIDSSGYESDTWPYLEVEDVYYPHCYDKSLASYNWDSLWQCSVKGHGDKSAMPCIETAGFNTTRLGAQGGGCLNIIAKVSDPQGILNIVKVEVLYEGTYLLDLQDDGKNGDFSPRDGVYGFICNFEQNDLQFLSGRHTLQIVAYDRQGNESDMWPYLHIAY